MILNHYWNGFRSMNEGQVRLEALLAQHTQELAAYRKLGDALGVVAWAVATACQALGQ